MTTVQSDRRRNIILRFCRLALTLTISSIFALAAFATSAESRDKKRGYSVKAGHNYSNRHYRSKRHYRGHRNSRKHRRGYRVMAGYDFDRYRRGRLVIFNNSTSNEASVPIKIEPLRPISQIIKITEHQKALGRKRAALRGQIGFDPDEHPLSVTGESSSRGQDNFGNYPKTYFND